MEPRAHHVLIGVFTVLVVLGALVATLWLSNAQSQSENSEYIVEFNEAVRGLTTGSAVQYSGITVGHVSELSLDPNDPRRVLAHIRIRSSVPIKVDTQARLALAGISGASVIQLTGGSPDSPDLKAQGNKLPVIVARRSSISVLLATSDDLMAGVSRLVFSAQRLLSQENIAAFSKTLKNTEKLSSVLAEHESDLATTMTELTKLSRQLNTFLEKSTQLVEQLEGLSENQLSRSLNAAENAFATLEASATSVNRLVQDNRGAVDEGARGLRNLGPALSELQETLSALRAVLRNLDNNPADYLLGRETLKEYTP